jgi:hypothetical protein
MPDWAAGGQGVKTSPAPCRTRCTSCATGAVPEASRVTAVPAIRSALSIRRADKRNVGPGANPRDFCYPESHQRLLKVLDAECHAQRDRSALRRQAAAELFDKACRHRQAIRAIWLNFLLYTYTEHNRSLAMPSSSRRCLKSK